MNCARTLKGQVADVSKAGKKNPPGGERIDTTRSGWSVGRSLGTDLRLREKYDSLRSQLHSHANSTLNKSVEVLEILDESRKAKKTNNSLPSEVDAEDLRGELIESVKTDEKIDNESVFKWSPAKQNVQMGMRDIFDGEDEPVSKDGESQASEINPMTGKPWVKS